jgi:hypothetical protein
LRLGELVTSLFQLPECGRCGGARAAYQVVAEADGPRSPYLWVCAECAAQARLEGRRVDRASLVVPFHG